MQLNRFTLLKASSSPLPKYIFSYVASTNFSYNFFGTNQLQNSTLSHKNLHSKSRNALEDEKFEYISPIFPNPCLYSKNYHPQPPWTFYRQKCATLVGCRIYFSFFFDLYTHFNRNEYSWRQFKLVNIK